MPFTFFKNTLIKCLPITLLFCFSCGSQNNDPKETPETENTAQELVARVLPGIYDVEAYLPLLKEKKVGIVANPTSVFSEDVNKQHLVDFLLSEAITVTKVFSPEHGFRGTADAGEHVKDGVDSETGLPIFSLHGKNRKPTPQQMEGLDVMVFDIQDVGVRFYTYLSTLHYVMEACAEANIPLLVLDRPNPNGRFVDGPMMEPEHKSFLGLHPVPLVYGMTIGEYAQMINGENWLSEGLKCELIVIALKGYTHQTFYHLPVRPSPNLPNDIAIYLYPSLGLLEGTNLNAGRGTEMQFQIMGSPYLPKEKYTFHYTPQPNFGSKNPKFNGKECYGIDLRNTSRLTKVELTWVVEAYHNYEKKSAFFNTENFTKHAGTATLQKQIEAGKTAEEIRESWSSGLEKFNTIRSKYLLYD